MSMMQNYQISTTTRYKKGGGGPKPLIMHVRCSWLLDGVEIHTHWVHWKSLHSNMTLRSRFYFFFCEDCIPQDLRNAVENNLWVQEAEKADLGAETGLHGQQIVTWFINYRKRVWPKVWIMEMDEHWFACMYHVHPYFIVNSWFRFNALRYHSLDR